MKNSFLKLLIPLVILAVLIGGIFAVSKLSEKTESKGEEVSTVIAAQTDTSTVTALNITFDKNTFGVAKNAKGQWQYIDDAAFPLSENKVNDLLTVLSSIESSRIVNSNASDTVQYGLSPASVQVVAETEDGESKAFKFGDESSTGDVYFCTNGDKKVYLVDSSIKERFQTDIFDLAQIENICELNEIKSVEVKGEESDICFTVSTKSKTDETKVYKARSGEKEISVSESAGSEFIDSIKALSFDSLVNYKGESEKYGLDSPAFTITLKGEKTDSDSKTVPAECSLLIGSKDDDGNYYACLKGSKNICLISADSLTDILVTDTASFTDTESNE
ncbi:MAG: DUF4340 domain-containing protein [Clostridiales bacterium]|nr:DUF4340 domain-containing protein [Clostridiales bacterium]